jgi:hypothetical protein
MKVVRMRWLGTVLDRTKGKQLLFYLMSCAIASGCSTSKWAMDDPVYAEKYGTPYGKNKLPRMTKQLLDARHLYEREGREYNLGVSCDPLQIGASLGRFGYRTASFSHRAALAGVVAESAKNAFIGVELGGQAQLPTRIAPFVGAGLFGGAGFFTLLDAASTAIEAEGEWTGLAAIYPETGIHFWPNSRVRLTLAARYFVSTEGRANDSWLVTLGLGLLDPPSRCTEMLEIPDEPIPMLEEVEMISETDEESAPDSPMIPLSITDRLNDGSDELAPGRSSTITPRF